MSPKESTQVKNDNSAQTGSDHQKKRLNFFWAKLLLVIVFLNLSFAIALFSWYLTKFNQITNLSLKQELTLIKNGFRQSKQFKTRNQINFLVLGLDRDPEERIENTLLTDTIIFFSFSPDNKALKSFSIPRDLWLDSLKTKVNSLFYYGEKKKPGFGPIFTKEQISQILGQPIDFYLVVNFSSLKKFANILGGVLIDVEREFTDPRYPLPHPERIETDNDEDFYEEIHFDTGPQLMDGETLLKFVRSRNSPDEIEGSDLGRSRRQQLVFKAILNSVAKPTTIFDPQRAGRVYQFYQSEVITNLTDENLLGLAMILLPSDEIKIKSVAIPIAESTKQMDEKILYHPPIEKYSLWVYEPVGQDFSLLQEFIAQEINNN